MDIILTADSYYLYAEVGWKCPDVALSRNHACFLVNAVRRMKWIRTVLIRPIV